MRLSISKLSELTGKDRRTISKRINTLTKFQDGYETRDALPLIYAPEFEGPSDVDEDINPIEEQALLARARREKIEVETAVLIGELCRVEDVEGLWIEHITNAKTRLLSLPHKAAPLVIGITDYAEAELVLKNIVNEALDELSGEGTPVSGDTEDDFEDCYGEGVGETT